MDDILPTPDGLDPSRAAYILHTSGSTGEPKGVVHTHLSAAPFVEWAVGELQIDQDDIIVQVASVSFDLSVFDVFGAVRRGALLAPIHESAMISPVTLCRAVAKAKATILYCVPSLILREIKSHELGWTELGNSALRQIVFAGEPINHQALKRFRPHVPDVTLHNWYGPTETNAAAITALPRATSREPTPFPSAKPAPMRISLISGTTRGAPGMSPASFWSREPR
ncbi:MAG TPA: AMP-binding protein [Methyloceanibacter sp.]|nr:AMP-binding protein [Methyloceanibacter sp.]